MKRYPRTAPTRPTVTRTGSAGTVLAVVVLAALLLVGLVLVVRWTAGIIGVAGLIALALVEVAVAGSMWLDWREARLEVPTARRAWLVAHATVITRTLRRARWYAGGIRMLVPPPRARRPQLEQTTATATDVEEARVA